MSDDSFLYMAHPASRDRLRLGEPLSSSPPKTSKYRSKKPRSGHSLSSNMVAGMKMYAPSMTDYVGLDKEGATSPILPKELFSSLFPSPSDTCTTSLADSRAPSESRWDASFSVHHAVYGGRKALVSSESACDLVSLPAPLLPLTTPLLPLSDIDSMGEGAEEDEGGYVNGSLSFSPSSGLVPSPSDLSLEMLVSASSLQSSPGSSRSGSFQLGLGLGLQGQRPPGPKSSKLGVMEGHVSASTSTSISSSSSSSSSSQSVGCDFSSPLWDLDIIPHDSPLFDDTAPYSEELEGVMEGFHSYLKGSRREEKWSPGLSHLSHVSHTLTRFASSKPHLFHHLAQSMNVKQLQVPCAEFDLPVEVILLLNLSLAAERRNGQSSPSRGKVECLKASSEKSTFGKSSSGGKSSRDQSSYEKTLPSSFGKSSRDSSFEKSSINASSINHQASSINHHASSPSSINNHASPSSVHSPSSQASKAAGRRGKSCASCSSSTCACHFKSENVSVESSSSRREEDSPIGSSSSWSEEEDALLALYSQNPVFHAEMNRLRYFLERMDTKKEVMAMLVWSLPDAALVSLTLSLLLPYPLCRSCASAFGHRSCGQCQIAKYCSRECQVKDWEIHQHDCPHLLDSLSNRFTICTIDPSLQNL